MIFLVALAVLGCWVGSGLVFWGLVQLTTAVYALVNREENPDLRQRLQDLEYAADLLPQKWEEMVKETRRAEGRAHQAVRRARTELAERGLADANLDEHAGELSHLDDLRGGNGAVPPVRSEVAATPAVPPGEDWEAITRFRKYGF